LNTNEAIKQLLLIVNELRRTYTNKKFTLDGRLVGDLGEIIVASNYEVELYPKLVAIHDGEDSRKRKVQIKSTFGTSLGFPCRQQETPDYYIGIKILPDGSFREIYNGPRDEIWELVKFRRITKNGLHSISISALERLNNTIPIEKRIRRR
jgi:hypothetical protein